MAVFPSKRWWILSLSLVSVSALAAGVSGGNAADDRDDDDNGPGLGDAVDVVDHLHDLSEHGGSAEHHVHVPAANEAEVERFVVHGGMSWEELSAAHQQARAAGSSVHFGEATGHAPNPFQVEPGLKPLGAPGEARFGQALKFGAAGEARAVQFGVAGEAQLGREVARGAQWVEGGSSLGAGRVALNVAEDVGVGSLGVARIAEEGLLLKVGGAALGLGGLAASRRRKQD